MTGLERFAIRQPADAAEESAWIEAGRRNPSAMEIAWHAYAARSRGAGIEACPFDDAFPEARARWHGWFGLAGKSDPAALDGMTIDVPKADFIGRTAAALEEKEDGE
jgi:hypothetical protein